MHFSGIVFGAQAAATVPAQNISYAMTGFSPDRQNILHLLSCLGAEFSRKSGVDLKEGVEGGLCTPKTLRKRCIEVSHRYL